MSAHRAAGDVRPNRQVATDSLGWAPAAVVGVIAAAVAFVAIHAWLPGTNDPDSMSSVLYFQRIAAGQHLEVTVLTAPKPLLTLVFGVTWNLVHDWRAIVWETIAIHGIGVALAARLASRIGGLAAGFAGVAGSRGISRFLADRGGWGCV